MSLTMTKPDDLSHEMYFHQECDLFQRALEREALSLHLLEDRREDTCQTLCDLIVELEIIKHLAVIMAKKSPKCATVLISPPGFFLGEFQEYCHTKILPILVAALTCLRECEYLYSGVNFTIAAWLESIHEDLSFVLDSRE
ncbi:uncharacterized protein N7515_000014 [Penicillium bovifimosum]|uniref:Uncharacterized protein n=1 Tax=Penicillium bovifimosum TaxID=126998 RepID=A0A9W9GFG0_9EURO|nr:uncharacterized protein N7515_010394 [Penicillium bovifimosum]XP_056525924.1 uncharacterized protein N7515_000014 [Penicillium bovifimosum]KAJ5118171.1 hypothetical protein N7515_010394 [Penicillium bovifimosum]KAJ5145450.1 hypothetical protein N7515_000014 [Penicillium bovifimosum]